jgi:HEPN domain-containing protein
MNSRSEKSSAFLKQAEFDYQFVAEIKNSLPLTPLCYRAAHCQQASEKAVKALFLKAVGEIKPSHALKGFIQGILRAAESSPKLRGSISRLFSKEMKKFLFEMEQTAPSDKWTKRNTEYPFEKDKKWTAPAEKNVFQSYEVEVWERKVGVLIVGVKKLFREI